MENAVQFIQQNGGKVIITIFINESSLYSLMKDGSWAEHTWSYDVEFNPEKIPESMTFNSTNEAIAYLKKSNNFPDYNDENGEVPIDSYSIFADIIPTQEQMEKCNFINDYTFVEVMEVMTGAFDAILNEPTVIEITDKVLV